MASEGPRSSVRLDALALFLAGLINTFLAPFDAAIIFGPGTSAVQPELMARVAWIAEHSLRWRGGWLFWFAVTLSFAWGYYALGRHLSGSRPWRSLAIGVALIAAAVDLVGVLINLVVIPELAQGLMSPVLGSDPVLLVVFKTMEALSGAIVNVAAFGLYSVAGLLLIPALFATVAYPRWLAWLGTAEWGVASLATVVLIMAPNLAVIPLIISFILYAPWVWASARWLLRKSAFESFGSLDRYGSGPAG